MPLDGHRPSPDPAASRPPVVVMGVSGCGKSTVGAALAARLGTAFLEGDDLHPPENIAKMAAGHPLDDGDRAGWLALVGAWLATTGADEGEHRAADEGEDGGAIGGRGGAATAGVASCSALARRYRDALRRACPSVWFLHLDVAREVVAQRVAGRTDHFMPAALVDSQLATLEPLGPDEAGIRVRAELPVERVVEIALAALSDARPVWQARGMVLEIAVFTAKPGRAEDFAAAYASARDIISSSPGCLSTRMTRGVENPDQFTLLVEWQTLEDHLEGFRGSDRFTRWRETIGPHFDTADVRHVEDLAG